MTITCRTCLLIGSLMLVPLAASGQTEPRQGMSMDEVRASLGAPAYDLGAIGSPAITRWVYDGFTVYFENRRVLHTVRTQPLSGSTATPAPAPSPVTPPAPAPSHVEAPSPAKATKPMPSVTPAAMPAPAEVPVVITAPAPEVPALAPIVDPEPAVQPMPAAPSAAAPSPAAPAAETATIPAPVPQPKSSGFRFDPATGRLILDSEESGEAPAASQPAEPDATPVAEEPSASATPQPKPPADAGNDNLGSALDEKLEFDPNTGTFRSIH